MKKKKTPVRKKGENKSVVMLTPRQYAKELGVAYTTVMNWLRNDLVPGVQKVDTVQDQYYYLVPSDAPKPQLKAGRPSNKPKTKKNEKPNND
jgi:hypothetical protein